MSVPPSAGVAAPPAPAWSEEDVERVAAIAKALGHPARVRIVRLLAGHEGCHVGDLAAEIGLAQSTVSEHLRILRQAEVISIGTLAGRQCYCLHRDRLGDLAAPLEELRSSACC